MGVTTAQYVSGKDQVSAMTTRMALDKVAVRMHG